MIIEDDIDNHQDDDDENDEDLLSTKKPLISSSSCSSKYGLVSESSQPSRLLNGKTAGGINIESSVFGSSV